MIVRLTFTNAMPVPVELRSNVASDQPLQPQQSVVMTLELHEGADGEARLQLACVPLRSEQNSDQEPLPASARGKL